jgi:hypothetical protein
MDGGHAHARMTKIEPKTNTAGPTCAARGKTVPAWADNCSGEIEPLTASSQIE